MPEEKKTDLEDEWETWLEENKVNHNAAVLCRRLEPNQKKLQPSFCSDKPHQQQLLLLLGSSSQGKHAQGLTTSDSTAVARNSARLLDPSTAYNDRSTSWCCTRRFRHFMLRTLLLDLPLLLLLMSWSLVQWLHWLHDEYYHDQLEAMVFTDGRANTDITYYERHCTVQDLSTLNGSDLFLPPEASPQEAYEHQLLHGFTVFRNVLSPSVAADLRAHILARNRNLSKHESIYVIENEHRYSWAYGTESVAVATAMMELARHQQLRQSLEQILGPDPALIEMTAITSTYGAIHQYWHDDVIPEASATRYARSFGPSFSLFILLQNTTVEMGATGVCPGSHYCSDPLVEQLCSEHGFPLVDENGVLRTGDALLMNMNSHHRGSAHTDPLGEDRVMAILTFVPQPRGRAESRLLGQGITFSLRWDLWGHTWSDLAQADTRMQQPWATLRALGLYKSPNAAWGIDYITGSAMRMANEDNGYRQEELQEYIANGGIWWLPSFLHGYVEDVDDESWYDYYLRTLDKCIFFGSLLCKLVSAAYASAFILLLCLEPKSSTKKRSWGVASVLLHLAVLWTIPFVLFQLLSAHITESGWAKDIKANRRHSSPFTNMKAFGVLSWELGSTTLPTRHDVLLDDRLASPYLAMYEDFVQGHPGNRLFNQLADSCANLYSGYPDSLRRAVVNFVVSGIQQQNGRFLAQGASGCWHWLSHSLAIAYIREELMARSNPAKRMLVRSVEHLISDSMYGIHRDTKLAQKHAVPYLRNFKKLLLQDNGKSLDVAALDNRPFSFQHSPVAKPITKELHRKQRSPFPPPYVPHEPEPGDWLAGGDSVETLESNFWYLGRATWISPHGEFDVLYDHGDMEQLIKYKVRPFRAFQVHEEVQVFYEDDNTFYPCLITNVNRDDTVDVYLPHLDESLYRLPLSSLRRQARDGEGDVPEHMAGHY